MLYIGRELRAALRVWLDVSLSLGHCMYVSYWAYDDSVDVTYSKGSMKLTCESSAHQMQI